MAAEEQESGRGFRVQDRRRFSPETGEPRAEGTEQKIEEVSQESQSPESTSSDTTQTSSEQSQDLVSFSSFILGLITQVLILMGEIPPPPGQQGHVDLAAARQMIDLLAMLKQKTKGNLDAAEDAMLENALFDLRMRYVQIAKGHQKTS